MSVRVKIPEELVRYRDGQGASTIDGGTLASILENLIERFPKIKPRQVADVSSGRAAERSHCAATRTS